jgi:hypothetical protein
LGFGRHAPVSADWALASMTAAARLVYRRNDSDVDRKSTGRGQL